MRSTGIFSVVAVIIFLCASGTAQAQVDSTQVLEARANLAASETYRVSALSGSSPNFSHNSIPVQGGRVVNTVLTGPAAMIGSVEIPKGLSDLQSDQAQTALALSTGQVGSASPAPGSAFEDTSSTPDQVKLSITLEPEPGFWMLFITWNLFTTEISSFSELGFNDVFSIHVRDGSGHRELLEVSSTDPRLRPVSNTHAAGSSFNLYSKNSPILTAEYGLGMPAAKMSGWRTTGFAVDSSAPIELEIELRDGMDGLMDTEVLIREIVFSAFLPPNFEAASSTNRERGLPVKDDCLPTRYCNSLFPNRGQFPGLRQPPVPPRFCTSGENLASQNGNLAQPIESRGEVLLRVVADGATRVPFFFGISGSGSAGDQVEFTMVNNSTAPQDGGLGELDSFDRLQTITIPAYQFVINFFGNPTQVWGAEVQFYAPETYYKDGLEDNGTDITDEFGRARPVNINACLKDAAGINQNCTDYTIELNRPDVMLVHGLWSGAFTWKQPFKELGFSEPKIPDYSRTNAKPFSENRYVPRDAMARACFGNFSESILGTQFDYIGHSMGGILARVYLYQAAPYRTINRLYTLNTPHLGSSLANLLIELRDIPILNALLTRALGPDRPIDQGAIDDLAEGSEALRDIPFTPILSHALVGIGGLNIENYRDTNLAIIDAYKAIRFLYDRGFAFDNQHDTVVSRDSQIGGLTPSAYTLLDGSESIHDSVTQSGQYASRLFCKNEPCPDDPFGFGRNDLMNKSGTGAFGIFPEPDGLMNPNPRMLPVSTAISPKKTITKMGVSITQPENGEIVEPGSTIQVSLQSNAPFIADGAMLTAGLHILIDEEPPFEFDVEIPEDLIGNLDLSVIAKDADGNFGTSDFTVISSQTSATLIEIQANPDSIFLMGLEDIQNLWVVGIFNDGVERNITGPATGTVYASSDPNIVTVSADGTLEPQSNGFATIIVSNGNVQDSVAVEVMDTIDLVYRDGFESSN